MYNFLSSTAKPKMSTLMVACCWSLAEAYGRDDTTKPQCFSMLWIKLCFCSVLRIYQSHQRGKQHLSSILKEVFTTSSGYFCTIHISLTSQLEKISYKSCLVHSWIMQLYENKFYKHFLLPNCKQFHPLIMTSRCQANPRIK